MRFEAGTVFAGYTIETRLGRGGMATVYLARESGIERPVALKILPEQLSDDAHFVARFEQEARVIGNLDHPNIIPLYRYGITEDVPWMALRFVDGGDFARRLAARPLALPEGLAVLKGVAAALDYAHRKGVIHRDLKPQNILLTSDGAPYLADFGVAKMLEGSASLKTSTGSILGTPSYMAPEQAQGLPLAPCTDVYALAVICFEWLTGKLPFDADTPHAVLMKHVMEPVPPEALRTLSSPVTDVLLRGLAKKPEQRIQTASVLIGELDQALFARPTIAIDVVTVPPQEDVPPPPPADVPPINGNTPPPSPKETPAGLPAVTEAVPVPGPAIVTKKKSWKLRVIQVLVVLAALRGCQHWQSIQRSRSSEESTLAQRTSVPTPAASPTSAAVTMPAARGTHVLPDVRSSVDMSNIHLTTVLLSDEPNGVIDDANDLAPRDFAGISRGVNRIGQIVVDFKLTAAGALKLQKLSITHPGSSIAIVANEAIDRPHALRLQSSMSDQMEVAFDSMDDANDFIKSLQDEHADSPPE